MLRSIALHFRVGLAYCAQEVLAAAIDMQDAAVGTNRSNVPPPGMATEEIRQYLKANAEALAHAALPPATKTLAAESARTLESLAANLDAAKPGSLEELERHLTVMEDKLLASLVAAATDHDLIAVRSEAERDIAPYRSKLAGAQIDQLHRQYVNKRLLERSKLPRLSLFYM